MVKREVYIVKTFLFIVKLVKVFDVSEMVSPNFVMIGTSVEILITFLWKAIVLLIPDL